jgi:3-deoxy-D-manno-octulosonic-acid transferase
MKHTAAYLFTIIYSATLELVRVLILPLLAKMKAFAGWNIAERSGLPPGNLTTTNRTRVWIHAASLGESRLLIKFLDILREKHPSGEYVLTAATPTGVDYLMGCRADDTVAVGFLPLDTLGLMKKLMRVFMVSRVWLMETELWPSMMLACRQSGIPVGIVNGRIEEKSFASYRRLGLLCQPIFKHLDVVLAQNETYADRFKLLGVRPGAVHVIGNLKSIVAVAPAAPDRRLSLRSAMMIRDIDFVLTAGCLHAGEGRVLKEALDILRNRNFFLKCIVVPRYLDETGTLIRELGPDTLRLSETAAHTPWETCIIDKMGILEDMYALSSVSFVGGTFVAVGGHNVWDAAKFGVPVIFGPDYHTQQESCDQLLNSGAGFTAATPEELARQIIAISTKDVGHFSSSLSMLARQARDRIARIEGLIP